MGGCRTGKGASDPSLGHAEGHHQRLSGQIWRQSCKPQAGDLLGGTVAPEMSRTCGHVRPLAKGTEGCHQLTLG